MVEKEIPIYSSLVIQFIETQEIREIANIMPSSCLDQLHFSGWENPKLKLIQANLLRARYLWSLDYQLVMGLEKDGIGIINPIELKCQKNTFGLDHKPEKED